MGTIRHLRNQELEKEKYRSYSECWWKNMAVALVEFIELEWENEFHLKSIAQIILLPKTIK